MSEGEYSELSVLIVEDSADDAEIMVGYLSAHGYTVRMQRVENADAFREALAETWDVILADYRLPQFNATVALEILRESEKDIPFIVVSEAIGEEQAVELMRSGASDYVMKSSLARLGPAVEREVREAAARRDARRSAALYQTVFDTQINGLVVINVRGEIIQANRSAERILRLKRDNITGRFYYEADYWKQVDRDLNLLDMEELPLSRAFSKGETVERFEHGIIFPDGEFKWLTVTCSPLFSDKREITGAVASFQDITDEFRQRERLDRQFKRLRLQEEALNGTSSGIIIADARLSEMPIIYVNRAFTKLTGYEAAEVIGANCRFLQGSDRNQGELIRLREALKKGEGGEFTLRNYRKDGTLFMNQLRLSPVRNEAGELTHYVAIQTDVTEKYQAQSELNRLSRLLSEAQRLARMGAWELDLQTRQTTWTDEVYRIHEVEPGIRYNLEAALSFYHPDDRPVLEAALRKTIETGEPYDLELRFVTAKGNPLWVRSSGYPVYEDHHVVCLRGMFQDITAAKNAAMKLQQSEERLALALYGGDLALWDWDIATDKAYFDARWWAMLGYETEARETSFQTWQNHLHPEDTERVLAALNKTLQNPDLPFEAEFRLKHKAGYYLWFLARGKIVAHDAVGKPLRMVGTHADITLRHEQEVKIAELSRRLIDIQEIERAEIASELHDVLGQSLVLTKLNLQKFLTDHNLHSPENEKLLLQPIADTLQRAREISRRLTPNHMKKVGLLLALEDMLQNAEKLSGVKIVTQLDALENYFPGNWSIECYRIVQEAVTNALKHSHATAIEVRARRIDKNLELVIADNGRGMSEGAASGIGMALMRERVRALGGHLFTQDGQPGLRLVVILPPPPPPRIGRGVSTAGDDAGVYVV